MCGIAGIYHLETAKPVDPARLLVAELEEGAFADVSGVVEPERELA